MNPKELLTSSKSQRKWWIFMVGLFFFATSFSAAIQSIGYFFASPSDEVTITEGDPIDEEIQALLTKYIDGVHIQNMFFFTYIENYTKRVLYSSANDSNSIPQPVFDDPEYYLAYNFHMQDVCYVKRVSFIDQTSNLYPLLIDFLDNDLELAKSSFYISCPVFAEDILLGYVSAVVINSTNGVVADMNLIQYIANKSSVLLSLRIKNGTD